MQKLTSIPIVLFFFLIAFKVDAQIRITPGETIHDLGAWFLCEFAHSQIPPNDKCSMLDDDGFQVVNNFLYHVKVKNSKQTRCRHKRLGQCFKKSQKGLIVERKELGPVKFYESKLDVTWYGCSQTYDIIHGPDFSEIRPVLEKCWWTPDKRYFVSEYKYKLDFTETD